MRLPELGRASELICILKWTISCLVMELEDHDESMGLNKNQILQIPQVPQMLLNPNPNPKQTLIRIQGNINRVSYFIIIESN